MAAGRHGEVLLEEMRTKKETDKETVERFGNISSIERYVGLVPQNCVRLSC